MWVSKTAELLVKKLGTKTVLCVVAQKVMDALKSSLWMHIQPMKNNPIAAVAMANCMARKVILVVLQ